MLYIKTFIKVITINNIVVTNKKKIKNAANNKEEYNLYNPLFPWLTTQRTLF